MEDIKLRHFINFDIAGFSFWEGAMVISELQPGMQLQLVREQDNHFDAYAVAIWFNNHKLGFVPRTMNHELSKFVEMGYNDIFDVRVQRVDPSSHPEHQVSVIIYLKKNE